MRLRVNRRPGTGLAELLLAPARPDIPIRYTLDGSNPRDGLLYDCLLYTSPGSQGGYFLGVGKGTGSKGASGQAQGLKETTA